ncbi:hypothetical protein C2P65_22605 [Salmonella enterica subsp. enterica]|nr:hypothetical protein [Salmonella enterica]EBD7299074.1 hypothetical protein [Salmonella enterica subsp. enterica]ECB7831148.1 hypothetical protein [Salmonella enterica subsp. enterica serovar Jodhpur]EEO6136007.1 hypothetical protein [Salmonella enterica]EGQ7063827.1 hypothetical protein [Salmonella enterica]
MSYKSNNFYRNILLLSFFFSGFSLYTVFIPLLFLTILLSLHKNKALYFGRLAASANILFIILFILFVFFIGEDRLLLEKPFKYAAYIIFMIFCLTLLLLNNIEYAQKAILFFIFGIFLRAEIIVIYSFLDPSGVYGYGKLLDPFNHEEINSPGISNSLAMVFVFLLVVFEPKTLARKIFLILAYPLLLLSSIFLGGRAFFIIAILGLVYQYKNNRNIKAIIFLLFSALGFLVLFFIMFKDAPVFEKYFNLIFERFGSEGLKSARFELIQDGISKFFMYPFGGFTPYASEYSGSWYHNIYLDSARVAGFLPLIMFLISNIILFSCYFKCKKRNHKNKYFFLSVITLIIMCQDVILEGNMMLLICYALFTTMQLQTGGRSKNEIILQSK